MIALKQVFYQYEQVNFHFDFHIAKQEPTVIVGPSGAGKSTLLSLIAGFIPPASGHIWLNQQDMTTVTPHKRPVSMLFQQNNVFDHLTVFQNVGLGIKPRLRLTDAERQAVMQILRKVGLFEQADRFPSELSGGQKQRIALARCLIQRRPILLLDEPFSALDQALRYEMLALIADICHEFELTLVMVSHYLDKTLDYFNRCLVVNEGQIVFNQPPSELTAPKYQKIATLLGFNH